MRSLLAVAALALSVVPALADNREYKTGAFTLACRFESDLKEAGLASGDSDWLRRINCGYAHPGLRVVRLEPDKDTEDTRLAPWRVRIFVDGGSMEAFVEAYRLVR